MFNKKGFTLVEMMIVVIIIAILVAIIMPNLVRFQDRAKEASVKANMHTLQLALEDFAIRTGGIYPDDGASATADGITVRDLCPGSAYPRNPFTGLSTTVRWDVDPASPGEIGINPANTSNYMIKAYGRSDMLSIQLTSGQ